MSLRRKKKNNIISEKTEVLMPEKATEKRPRHINFNDYVGQTVTVFVNSGGIAGKGFTGVLILHTETYIKLLVLPSVPPECSLGNTCSGKEVNPFFCCLCPYNRTLGAIAEIPIVAVVAFVHNAVN